MLRSAVLIVLGCLLVFVGVCIVITFAGNENSTKTESSLIVNKSDTSVVKKPIAKFFSYSNSRAMWLKKPSCAYYADNGKSDGVEFNGSYLRGTMIDNRFYFLENRIDSEIGIEKYYPDSLLSKDPRDTYQWRKKLKEEITSDYPLNEAIECCAAVQDSEYVKNIVENIRANLKLKSMENIDTKEVLIKYSKL